MNYQQPKYIYYSGVPVSPLLYTRVVTSSLRGGERGVGRGEGEGWGWVMGGRGFLIYKPSLGLTNGGYLFNSLKRQPPADFKQN